MKVFFDENFPPQIARALQILQSPKNEENIEVLNIADAFGRGTADEVWIPEVGKLGGVVVTQDIRIQNSRQQNELYKTHKLGIVFLKPPSKNGYNYWESIEKIIASWKDIKETITRTKPPFAFIIRPRSKNLEQF